MIDRLEPGQTLAVMNMALGWKGLGMIHRANMQLNQWTDFFSTVAFPGQRRAALLAKSPTDRVRHFIYRGLALRVGHLVAPIAGQRDHWRPGVSATTFAVTVNRRQRLAFGPVTYRATQTTASDLLRESFHVVSLMHSYSQYNGSLHLYFAKGPEIITP